MRVSLVSLPLFMLGAALTSPVTAQTTPTERHAAGEILQQIDALQARLKPTDTARRLAGKSDRDRDATLARVEELWTTEMQDLSDHIGRNPEVGFKEFKSVDTLTSVLRTYGFAVETGQADLPTAFHGRRDGGSAAWYRLPSGVGRTE